MMDTQLSLMQQPFRPPITVRLEQWINGAIVKYPQPFPIGVIGNYAGDADRPLLWDRQFEVVEGDWVDGLMPLYQPQLYLQVPNLLSGEKDHLDIHLHFTSMQDFQPLGIVRQCLPLAAHYVVYYQLLTELLTRIDSNRRLNTHLAGLLANPQQLYQLGQEITDAVQETPNSSGVDESSRDIDYTRISTPIITSNVVTRPGPLMTGLLDVARCTTTAQRERFYTLVWALVHKLKAEVAHATSDLKTTLTTVSARAHQDMSILINHVLHDKSFQALEVSWRGLQWLHNGSIRHPLVKIKVFDARPEELQEDFAGAGEKIDRTVLFDRVYTKAINKFGGEAFGVLISDYTFSPEPRDMTLLEGYARVAAAAHVTFLAEASPTFFGLRQWSELDEVYDLVSAIDRPENILYHQFRRIPDARYVALTAMRIAARMLYGPQTLPVAGWLNFLEEATRHAEYLWMSAAFALGRCMKDSFIQYGHTHAIRGVQGGGLISNLPLLTYVTDRGKVAAKPPVEFVPDFTRAAALAALGFTVPIYCMGTNYAVFDDVPNAHQSEEYDTPEANTSAYLSDKLPNIMLVSEFARALTVMMHNHKGRFTEGDELGEYLNRWLRTYVDATKHASQEQRSKYPLQDGRVDVFNVPGKPGAWRGTAFIKPHTPFEELAMTVHLVDTIPQLTDRAVGV